jgi:hypothetical protein
VWVNFYINGSYYKSSPPYQVSWSSAKVGDGNHTISVAAFGSNYQLIGMDSVTVKVANNIHFSGGSLLPRGALLPSESYCASQVIRSSFEPRPENYAANHRIPTSAQLQALYSGARQNPAQQQIQRVTGNFTGTTDEIMQWAACKWGFDVDTVRANAVIESWWRQSTVGDVTTNQSLCPWGQWNGTQCYQSWGLLQIKYIYHPWAWPMSRYNTAFNVDYVLANRRACMEGKMTWLADFPPQMGYPNYPNGTDDEVFWGCVGYYYSGRWYNADAIRYIERVQQELIDKVWVGGSKNFY